MDWPLDRAVLAERELYDQIGREFGLLAAGELESVDLPGARRAGRVLAVRRDGEMLFPGFQLDESGHLRPVIADLIAVGRRHGRTELGLVQWLMSPTTYLEGRRPVDVIDDPLRLLDAARSAFGVEW